MDKFEREFFKILKEDITAGDALGGSEGLKGGSVGNTDSYAPGNQKLPKSIFGGAITRKGIIKCKKCERGKRCKACKKNKEVKESK